MSLFDEQQASSLPWGTIFTQGGELDLGGVERSRSAHWTEKDEEEYLERVRQKASRLGEGLIAEAQTKVDAIRRQAEKEGYDAGLAKADDELVNFRSDLAESVAALLGTIEGQCSLIFEQWREEIVGVMRLAVQRVTGVEIAEQRDKILEALLVESVGLLEKRRELVIRVNPEDEPLVSDIVSFTKERFADIKSWRVRADAEITSGGMVVESESSLAEGRLESRAVAVDEVLRQMTLPDKKDRSTDHEKLP